MVLMLRLVMLGRSTSVFTFEHQKIHPKAIIEQASDRGAYVCQSQSMNIFLEDPDITKLSNMHFYSWKKGLKTGIYYLRTRPVARVQAFSQEAKKYEREDTECLSCGA